MKNVFSSFGYNRDGKKGKRQIVVGLLCNSDGIPLAIEVFKGNTNDSTTVGEQLEKIKSRFHGKDIVFVGDRGMIKSKQVRDILARNYHYITGLTRVQIENLLKEGTIDMSLFDVDLCDVEADGVRYILRYNPIR